MSGGILKDITKGASILGMFILAVLVERWVSINFIVNLPGKVMSKGAYIEWPKGNVTGDQLKTILGQVNDKLSFDKIQVDTLQKQLDSLIPGLMGLLLIESNPQQWSSGDDQADSHVRPCLQDQRGRGLTVSDYI